jgi:hypothetical protein
MARNRTPRVTPTVGPRAKPKPTIELFQFTVTPTLLERGTDGEVAAIGQADPRVFFSIKKLIAWLEVDYPKELSDLNKIGALRSSE